MLRRSLLLLCLQITVVAACVAGSGRSFAAFAAAPQVHRIANPGPSEFLLDGPWQFHLGDNPEWKSPSFDDSGWEQLTADQSWGSQGHPNTEGFAWYRLHLEISPGQSPPGELAILIPWVEDAYELYWNGRLVGSYGKLPPRPVWYFKVDPQTFSLGAAESGVLALRVWKAPFVSYDDGLQGGFRALPVVGGPLAISDALTRIDYRRLRGRQFLFGLNGLYALVALIGLMAWQRDRSQWAIFWMAGFAIAKPLSLLLLLGKLPLTVMFLFYSPIFGFGDISLWFLLLWLLDLHGNPKLVRLTSIVAAAALITQTLDGLIGLGLVLENPEPFQTWDFRIQFLSIASELFPIFLVALAIARRRHLDSTRWFVALFAFLSQTTIATGYALGQGNRFTHWTLSNKLHTPLFSVLGNRFDAQTIFDALLLISIVYAVYRSSVDTYNRQMIMEREFHNARELQQVLIPEDLPVIPGYALTTAYKPALDVGGDFFQIIPLEDGETLIVLGDVSGKGLKAAMTVSLIVGSIRMAAETTTSPAQILTRLNRRLHGRLRDGFATAIALLLKPNGSCILSSAGHTSPFLNDLEVNLTGAFPLGLLPSATYEEMRIQISASDQLALYTDGLLEARNPSGDLYGFERLNALFASRPTAEEAAQAAVAFGQDDDITVLTLTRLDEAA